VLCYTVLSCSAPPVPHLQSVALCDVPDDPHTHAGAGEGVALDERLRHTQQPADGADLDVTAAAAAAAGVAMTAVAAKQQNQQQQVEEGQYCCHSAVLTGPPHMDEG